MKYRIMKVDELREHSENKKYFTDIEETSPAFWKEFKDNILAIGIMEPLRINEETMEVMSGNQRLKACIELGVDKVPVVLVSVKDDKDEVIQMISSNVMRRGDTDPLKLMEYIGILRKGYNGKSHKKNEKENNTENKVDNLLETPTQENVGQLIGKDKAFISAADKFNALIKEHKTEIEIWYQENHPTQAELIKKVKNYNELENRINSLDESLKNREERIEKIKEV